MVGLFTLTVMTIALPEETNCRILYRKTEAGLSVCSLSASSTGHFQSDSRHQDWAAFSEQKKTQAKFFPESLLGYWILPKTCKGTQEFFGKTPSSRNCCSIRQKKKIGGNNWIDSLNFYWSPLSLFSSWGTFEKQQIHIICLCLSRMEREILVSQHMPAEAGFPPH